jgi:cytochrome c553
MAGRTSAATAAAMAQGARAGFRAMLGALALAAFACARGVAAQDEEAAPAAGAGIEAKAQLCFSCHGPQGASTNEKYPVIAGQHQYYLYLQLKDFRAGRRQNAEMEPILAALTTEDLMPLAEYFSQQKWPSLTVQVDPAKVQAGEAAADSGECPQCHLGGYNGASSVPRLAGQHLAYLEKTMLEFKSKTRNNQPAMSSLMAVFSDEDIVALAHFLASRTVTEAPGAVEIQ